MSSVSKRIGQNISYFRKLRGMTLHELCESMTALGDVPVSAGTVSAWEHGTRSVSAEHFYYLSKALDVLPMELYDGDQSKQADRARAVVQAAGYSEHERSILRYAALDWNGDTHALIEWIGAYMSMCPVQRSDAAGYLIYNFEKAVRKGWILDVPYQTDIQMLKKKLEILEES